MNISQKEIEIEFKRQVFLNSGLGKKLMIEIIEDHFNKSKKESVPMEREQDSGNCNWDYLRSY